MAEMLLMPDVWLRAMDGVAGNALVVWRGVCKR